MKHSLQRQRRLLAVRSLQADFAAAEVRRSQMAAAEIQIQVQAARLAARSDFIPALSHSAEPGAWLLNCAEQELAGIKIDIGMQTLQEIDARTESLRLQDMQARPERAQIGKVCERLKNDVDYQEQVREQATLDDIFSASFLSRRQCK